MPQFDFYSAFIQCFFLILAIICLHFIVQKFVLPQNFFAFRMREKIKKISENQQISKKFLINKIFKIIK